MMRTFASKKALLLVAWSGAIASALQGIWVRSDDAAGDSQTPGPLFQAVPADKSGLTQVIPKSVVWPWMSPLVDINHDGALDILRYGHHGGGAAIWFGNGDGTFTFDAAGYHDRWGFGGRDPVWWDFTGDGWMDAVGTEGFGIVGALFRNDGTGHFIKLDPARYALWGELVDLDGDGYFEESWYRGAMREIRPKFRQWNDKFPVAIETLRRQHIRDIVGVPAGVAGNKIKYVSGITVDLDGDDRNELIVRTNGPFAEPPILYSWVLTRNPGATGISGWEDTTEARGLPTGPGHSFVPEDVDADGDLDLADLRSGYLYLNDGAGHFSQARRMFDPGARRLGHVWDGDNEPHWCDLDNNGFRDLIIAGEHTAGHGVFLNRGAGVFEEVTDRMPFLHSRRDFALGDVDGDGDLDAVHGYSLPDGSGDRVRLLKGTVGNRGLTLRIVPEHVIYSYLGAKIWVYEAGGLGDDARLLHYRQGYFERPNVYHNSLAPRLHVGIGPRPAADVRVRFPSGKVTEVRHVAAGSEVIVQEAAGQ